ncbi:MAG TPA: hypothetical protein VNE39_23145, partial [Planctomycetota bacterium]|nr:hypothetical protein [Planctomycetota bacterium]
MRRPLAATLLAGMLAIAWQAAPAGALSPDVPGVEARLSAAAKQIRAKQFAEAEETLLALEKEKGLDDPTRARVYLQFMQLYGATGDGAKRIAAAKDALALRGAEGKQKTEALLAAAAAADFGARYEARYLHLRPDADVRTMERENRLHREELVRLNPGNVACRIALGALYVAAGEADKA